MRPMLWKELRELRWWIAGGVASLCALVALFQSERIYHSFSGAYPGFLMPLLLAVWAIGLGAGQVARERHSRTLEYLLVRPISPATIVWVKFLAGSIALAVLVPGIVAVAYVHTERLTGSMAEIYRDVPFRALVLTLLPRYWCIYALTLFVSVVLDRSAKVAGLMSVMAVTLPVLTISFLELSPFSHFTQWLPFIDPSFGLLLAARNGAITFYTGAVYSGATLLVVAAAAAFLRRSSEKQAGTPGFLAISLGIVGAAVLSAHGAATRFPTVPPSSVLEIEDKDQTILASGDLVAALELQTVRFYDFHPGQNPHEIARVSLPIPSAGFSSAMSGDTVYVVGRRRGLEEDSLEMLIVRPFAPVQIMALGAERLSNSIPVPIGGFLYKATRTGDRCELDVFNLTSQQKVSSLDLECAVPALSLRGSYLYIANDHTLTTFDVSNPALPVVASRQEIPVSFVTTFSTMAWRGNRLFVLNGIPSGLRAFDLSDPAHPVLQNSMEYHNSSSLLASTRALYRPWQQGFLEFSADDGDLRSRRYLSNGERISASATGGDTLFALTVEKPQGKRRLLAFR